MKARIISASRRTDIPAFYARWFMNRVRAGFCTYPNPYRPSSVCRVDLRPDAVAGVVFWTRNARPMLRFLPELDERGFGYVFQYTLVNYPRAMDPRSPSVTGAADTLRELCEHVGRDRIAWRYDPIILTADLDEEWHRRNIDFLLDLLGDRVGRLVVSVVDPYRKTQRRIGSLESGEVRYQPRDYLSLLAWIASRAAQRGLPVQSCAEPLIDSAVLAAGPCVDAAWLQETENRRASAQGQEARTVPSAGHGQRPGCLCHRSVDIGVNNTCGFGCRYCYAGGDHEKALLNLARHDPQATCLAGDG